MKLLIQRVKHAEVKVNNELISKIDTGFLVFVGITHTDNKEKADYLAKKLCNLRVFEDENGKMNLNIKSTNGKILVVSQFTLYAECEKSGNRPSFSAAAKPEFAKLLYDYFCVKCEEEGLKVEKGIFGADMKVSLLNDGPVTILLEK